MGRREPSRIPKIGDVADGVSWFGPHPLGILYVGTVPEPPRPQGDDDDDGPSSHHYSFLHVGEVMRLRTWSGADRVIGNCSFPRRFVVRPDAVYGTFGGAMDSRSVLARFDVPSGKQRVLVEDDRVEYAFDVDDDNAYFAVRGGGIDAIAR